MQRFKVRSNDGVEEVWDPLRRCWLKLTPEEKVRQWFISVLTSEMGITPQLISQEYPIELNGRRFRADIVVFGSDRKPYMVIECKSADVELDESVFLQVAHYNIALGTPVLALTNGRNTMWFRLSDNRKGYIRIERP